MSSPVTDYYRRNFLSLLDSVYELYEDLLKNEELDYIEAYRTISVQAQRLYARLVTRVGPLFRSDKLAYPEIPDLSGAANELAAAGLLRIDAEYEAIDTLPMLKKEELKAMVTNLEISVEGWSKAKKQDIIDAVLLQVKRDVVDEYRKRLFSVYEPLALDILSILMLLFFGNYRQDLSEFVITDLGIVTYENYPLERAARPFKDRRTIDQRVYLHLVAEELYEGLRDLSVEEILECWQDLSVEIPDPGNSPHIQRRYGRICNELARQLERLGAERDALDIYDRIGLPPSRERRARIHAAAGEYHEAELICTAMKSGPLNEDEYDFATIFLPKIEKKMGKTTAPVPKFTISYQEREIPIADSPLVKESVEEYALEGFLRSGYSGFYTENQLWNALFGLAFWDVVFLPLEGVFYNRYQRGPADLYNEEFAARRHDRIEERFDQFEGNDTWRGRILDTFDEKFGVACALVNWKQVTREMVRTAIDSIPGNHLVVVFRRMMRDIRNNSTGFPDLLLFPPSARKRRKKGADDLFFDSDTGLPYLLVEVKGPGDQVQKNQKRWMRYFSEHDIPYRVYRMRYAPLAGET